MDRKRDTIEERIIVIGSSCSGKSSFAKALAAKKKIKHIELDQLHWLPTFFSRDSIIWWVIKTFHKKRSSYEALLKEQTKCGVKVVELKGQGQVDCFLRGL